MPRTDFVATIGPNTIPIKKLDLDNHTAEVNGNVVRFDFRHVSGDLYFLMIDDQPFSAHVMGNGEHEEVRIGPHLFEVRIEDERAKAWRKCQPSEKTAAGQALIRAPIPGLVVRVEVSCGEIVEMGRGLLVIEAMKMENEIKSPVAGKVAEVLVTTGVTVEKNTPLIRITS